MDPLTTLTSRMAQEGRIPVAPLMGFPGVGITGSTIKIAQQNSMEHFRVIAALYERFTPDIVFPLMDLSVEASALGFYTLFPVDETPTVIGSGFSMEHLDRLAETDIAFDSRAKGYIETVQLLSSRLPKHVIRGAYVTGPFTLAGLMVGASNAAEMVLMDPEWMHRLCRFTSEVIGTYATLLRDAGAECICFLEPSAVFLGPAHFREFSVGYLKPLIDKCNNKGVATIYHICGNTSHLTEEFKQSGVTALSLDSREAGVLLSDVMGKLSGEMIIMGNISPTGTLLHGTPDDVIKETTGLLNETKGYHGFILSSGCDLPPETPLENIAAFMASGRAFRKK